MRSTRQRARCAGRHGWSRRTPPKPKRRDGETRRTCLSRVAPRGRPTRSTRCADCYMCRAAIRRRTSIAVCVQGRMPTRPRSWCWMPGVAHSAPVTWFRRLTITTGMSPRRLCSSRPRAASTWWLSRPRMVTCTVLMSAAARPCIARPSPVLRMPPRRCHASQSTSAPVSRAAPNGMDRRTIRPPTCSTREPSSGARRSPCRLRKRRAARACTSRGPRTTPPIPARSSAGSIPLRPGRAGYTRPTQTAARSPGSSKPPPPS